MNKLASMFKLDQLVGKTVKANTDFSGIATGTEGVVDEVYRISRDHEGIMVAWKLPNGHKIRDGFGRDSKFDETQWLEVVET